MDTDLGPQYAWDTPFTARMRLHQSWYRGVVLGVPYGCDRSGQYLGNLLQPEYGARGFNFLSSDIAGLAERSRADNPRGIEQDRLERNLLGSQPMCFNLFGPMALDQELRQGLVQALTDEPVSEVTRVKFEHAPEPFTKYLYDGTAFDVFIEFRSDDGELRFIGFEAKLSEPFSPVPYPLSARPAYQRWVDLPSAPWKPSRRESLDAIAHNQLWRDHMLAFALKEAGPEGHASGELFLIRHPGDLGTAAVVRGYTELLKAVDTSFTDMPLDDLLTRWMPVVNGTDYEPWLHEFERRYVDLSGSEPYRGALA
jgi:hypothetical protein